MAQARKKTVGAGSQQGSWAIRFRYVHFRKIDAGVVLATGWPSETWVAEEPGRSYAPMAQLQLYYADGKWNLWSGNIVKRSVRDLGERLATARNRAMRRRAVRS